MELLLSVSLMAILAFISAPLLATAYTKSHVSVVAQDIEHTLERAQQRTVDGRNDGVWGVAFTTTSYTLFKGTSYATREAAFDEEHTVAGSLQISATSAEVIFTYRKGLPSTIGTITVTDLDGGASTSIEVNASGVADLL